MRNDAVKYLPQLLFSLRLQLERDIDFPPVAFGDLIDVADRDVILLEPKLYGVADDVKLLSQSLVGNGCRLHGLTYEIQSLSWSLDGASRLFNDQPGAFYLPHRNGIGDYEVIAVVVSGGDDPAEGGVVHHKPACD